MMIRSPTNSGAILALCMFSLAVVVSSSCTQDSDCGDGGKCGRSEALTDAPFECCASGKSSWEGFSLRYVCTDLSSGSACNGENDLCASGICGIDNVCLDEKIAAGESCRDDNMCALGACGRSEALTDAPFECCASGKSSWEGFSLRYVCTDLSSGAACNGENDLCASGICGIDNICLDEKIAAGESCRDDNMCALGACGRSEALTDAPFECCASGKSSWEGFSLRYVCSDLIPGAACNGIDDICWSKTCGLDGVCTKQVDGGSCLDDVDCQNNVCGRVEASLDASYVCCPSGETVDGDISGVCTAFGGIGAACFEDSTCKSGVCVQQTCKDKQENENDLCEADHHCASASCIMGACAPFSSTNSRNEYFNGKAACPLDTLSSANEGDTSVVSLDVYGDSTETSWMDSMMNMVTTSSVDSSATANTLVGQELLYGIDGCVNGGSVVAQRQGNKVCYGFQKEEDDGDGNSSFTCSNQCIEIGASGSFETYDKGDLDCIGLSPVQCFYFGKSEKCRIKATVSASQPNQIEDSNPTSGSASQPNQAEDSNPTSGSASQLNQAEDSNPTPGSASQLNQAEDSSPTSGSASQPNQAEDSNPTSGSASQLNQAEDSSPTSGSASQLNQAEGSNPTSASPVLAGAYSPSLLFLVQILLFVVVAL
eukprot:scaffold1239_cov95-Skeletonema_menzelii.AAC.1